MPSDKAHEGDVPPTAPSVSDTVAAPGRAPWSEHPDDPPIHTLGRYRVGALLGAGGMGAVYEAHDPQLDRIVAVKVLRSDREASLSRQLRLLREAKTMARLSHPNVIHVYDVGVAEGRVFVAMEHVKGGTLGQWLARETRTPAAILDTFVAAGAGLAAAHEAGLVHRDFKPSNVMVTDDGRVLVTDFGLARSSAELSSSDPPEPPAPGSNGTITVAGVAVGTPAYMAPEQLAAEVVDARADQFSFCVSLWEALYGVHPFGDVATTARSEAGPREVPRSASARVQASVQRALLRGLAASPAARHASMRGLLDALMRDPARTRRRWALGAGTVLCVAALGAAGARATSRPVDPCAGGDAKMRAVWDSRSRAAVEAAFEGSGLPYAKTAFDTVAASLDGYARKWSGMYREACVATRVRGEQSDELLDLRMTCLSDHLRDVGAFTTLLARADRGAIERSPETAQTIAPIDDCANVASLRGEARLPTDAKSRASIDEVRTSLATARALDAAGHFQEGVTLAKELDGRAGELEYRPLEAEVLVTLGSLESGLSDYAAADPALERAVLAATAGRVPRLAAQAEVQLAEITGYFQQQFKDGERWADRAQASLEAEGDDGDVRVDLLLARGTIAREEGRNDEALADARDALALASRLHGETSLPSSKALGSIGNTLARKGSVPEALATLRRALAIKETLLGPAHPLCGHGWMNLGAALHEAHDEDGALDAHERALSIDERLYGHENVETARDLDNIALVLVSGGKAARAEPIVRDALEVKEKLLPAGDVEIAFSLGLLGNTLDHLHRYAEARPIIERAVTLQTAAAGADSLDAVDFEEEAAKVLLGLGDLQGARRYISTACEVTEAKLGAKSPFLAAALLTLAQVERASGDAAGALRTVMRATAIYDADPDNQEWDTESLRLELAQAIWPQVAMRSRSREIASLAVERARAQGPAGTETAADAERWLAAHP